MDELTGLFKFFIAVAICLCIGITACNYIQANKPYPTDPSAQRIRELTYNLSKTSGIRYDVYQQLMNSAIYSNEIPEWVNESLETTRETQKAILNKKK